MGVAGFRLDAIKYYNTGGDDGIEFLTWFMKTAKELKEDCYIIGENWWGSSQILEWYSSGIDSQFNFPMSQADGHFANAARSGNVKKLCTSLQNWGENLYDINENAINASFLSNHDMKRSGAGLGRDLRTQKMGAMCYMLAPGNSFTYYGEEVALLGSTDNDGSYRLPMPWDGTEWEKIHLPSIPFDVAEESVTTTVEEAIEIADKYNDGKFDITIEINVSARGSIDIFGTSESKEYYVGVGKIMGSVELQSKLKQTLNEYIAEVLPVNIEHTNLFERYREAVNELDAHNKRIEDEKLLNEQLNIINEYNGNGDVYVIVRNNSNDKPSPFTYRNKGVIWIDSEVHSYSSAMSVVNKLNNRSFHKSYKYVPLHMLKRNIKYAL